MQKNRMTDEENRKYLPLVSVIITTYQNEQYLPRAIESVLNQTYSNVELIVVDDNAPDSPSRRATEQVVECYPTVMYICHPENRNGAAARNTGIKNANGEYIAFLDNDDFYFRRHIENCIMALLEHPECDCVLCDVLKIREGFCWACVRAPEKDFMNSLLFSETALGTGSNLFLSARAATELGGFDVSFSRHQDVEFGLRLFSEYKAISLKQVEIVKEMDGYSNAPDFDRFFKAKQQLWRKFNNEINHLNESERNRFYAGQYSALLYTACKEGKSETIHRVAKELRKYRSLSVVERSMTILAYIGMFDAYEGVKKMLKQAQSGRLMCEIMQSIEKSDQEMLHQALNS